MKKNIFFLNLLFVLFISTETYAQWEKNGTKLYYTAGSVGIGQSSPSYVLDVNDRTRIQKELILDGVNGGDLGAFITIRHSLKTGTNQGWEWKLINAQGGSGNGLRFGAYSKPNGHMITPLFLGDNGYVGIGTVQPTQRLDVKGNINLSTPPNVDLKFLLNQKAAISYFNTARENTLWINRNWSAEKGFYNDFDAVILYGKIGIGLTNPNADLDVAGTIRAHEVKVCVNQGCDFVFAPDYKLMSLEELSKFITNNKHLPEIVPAESMESKGIDLAEMNMKLLQKLEENTLYILKLNEQVKELTSELNRIKEENNLL